MLEANAAITLHNTTLYDLNFKNQRQTYHVYLTTPLSQSTWMKFSQAKRKLREKKKKNRLMVSDRRGLGEWIGHSGLADANHYIYRMDKQGIQYPVINQNGKEGFKEDLIGTSLVVQWLRIPRQGHGFHPWSRESPHAKEQLNL